MQTQVVHLHIQKEIKKELSIDLLMKGGSPCYRTCQIGIHSSDKYYLKMNFIKKKIKKNTDTGSPQNINKSICNLERTI